MERQKFADMVYHTVSKIPPGQVATYGQIAFLLGFPNSARQVGYALSHTPAFLKLPCHRVVNRCGRTAPNWPAQRRLLEQEGVPFRDNGTADLARCLWQP